MTRNPTFRRPREIACVQRAPETPQRTTRPTRKARILAAFSPGPGRRRRLSRETRIGSVAAPSAPSVKTEAASPKERNFSRRAASSEFFARASFFACSVVPSGTRKPRSRRRRSPRAAPGSARADRDHVGVRERDARQVAALGALPHARDDEDGRGRERGVEQQELRAGEIERVHGVRRARSRIRTASTGSRPRMLDASPGARGRRSRTAERPSTRPGHPSPDRVEATWRRASFGEGTGRPSSDRSDAAAARSRPVKFATERPASRRLRREAPTLRGGAARGSGATARGAGATRLLEAREPRTGRRRRGRGGAARCPRT